MKVVITGGQGQLGLAVAQELGRTPGVDEVVASRRDLDICQAQTVQKFMSRECPAWVINCAGYTDVEGAEDKSEAAYLVNERAVGFLADAVLEVKARLVHISTDYVFSGAFGDATPRSYTEEDPPGPINVYGASKLAGEIRLLAHAAPSLILRTSWLYGGREKNFLATMLRLGKQRRSSREPLRVVDDQYGTPTDCWSLARQIVRLLSEDGANLQGVVHASCEGKTNWCEFAREIFRQVGWDVPLEAISTAEFPARARRPAHAVLENKRLKEHCLLELPPWREALARALKLRSHE